MSKQEEIEKSRDFQEFKSHIDREGTRGERQKINTKQYRNNYDKIDWSKKRDG